MAVPAQDAPLRLTTDASDTAIGASLEQSIDDIWRPIGFFSKKLIPAQTRYSTYDRELLAIFSAIKFFKHLLEDRQFVIRTDHKPLTYMLQTNLEKASKRQIHHITYIAQFNAVIMYVKGDDNIVADALSRINEITMPAICTPEKIAEAQADDKELQELIDSNNTSLKLQSIVCDLEQGIRIHCDISTGVVRPFIPKSLRKIVFNTIHGLSHPSGRNTCRMLREKCIWPGMKKDILALARNCLHCQRAKIQRHNKVKPIHIDVPDNRFSHIHIDLIELPVVKGLRYCLTMIDRFSRWPEVIPLPDMTADTVATAFYSHWICRYGSPITITSDQGSQFESALFTALTRLVGADKTRTTPYHPASNGLVERMHRTLKAALMCAGHIPWPDLLPTVLLGMRASFKEDLRASPAELLYGTTLRLPGEFFCNQELVSDPQNFMEKFREHMQGIRPTPTAHHIKAKIFILKDLYSCTHVFIRQDGIRKPLEHPYQGPYEVIKRINDKVFIINVNGEQKSISVERLKPVYFTKDDDTSKPEEPINIVQPHHWGSIMDKPIRTYAPKKKVSFASSNGVSHWGGSECGGLNKLRNKPK